MSKPLLMNQNYVNADTLYDQSYSSQIAAAPATNVQDKIRRTKVWRSAGYFLITSANKSIVFRESVGVDLTASIVEGEYTTDATFLTAIKTALEAAGASTYTITRDTSTNKIKIASDGGGGGGILQLMWTDVGSTAYDVLGFSNGADDTGALTYTADSLRIHTAEWIRWDLGTSSNPKGFAMTGKRNESIGLSATATIKLQGSSTDVWTSPVFEQTLDWHEECVIHFDSDGLHSSALRYWRLLIVDRDNPAGYIEVSNVYLGDTWSPTQGSIAFPLEFEYEDLSKSDVSDFGVTFSNIRQQTIRPNLNWEMLTSTEVETMRDFVEEYSTAYPFFIALDPDGVYSSAANKWTKMVRLLSPPKFRLVKPNLWTSDWSIREEV